MAGDLSVRGSFTVYRGAVVNTARVMAKLEPGGAQLSMLRVMAELRGRGIDSELLCGWASEDGLALARAHGIEPKVWGDGGNLQWTPDPAFAAWLAPRLMTADLIHAHMFGAWWAAARAQRRRGTPLVASEHNQYLWPDRAYGDEMRDGLERVDVFFAQGRAPATRCSRTACRSSGCARASRRSSGRRTGRAPGCRPRASSSPGACTPTRAPTS